MCRADVAPASILKEKVGLASRKRIRPVWRHFLNREETVKRRTFDSSLYRSPNISPRASFRFRLGRNLIRITVADRLSQPRETRRPFQCFPRARRETSDERGGYRALGRPLVCAEYAARTREGISFRGEAGDRHPRGTPTFSNLEGRVRRSTALLRQTS